MAFILTDFSKRLQKVAKNADNFRLFCRGVERETLRYSLGGRLATTPHPEGLGAALTNRWITTDFSESLLEFITPVSANISETLDQLADIHHFTQTQMNGEKFWPLSMPCFVEGEDSIQLAQYGRSNIGKMKTLYRNGLKHRYGSLMQIISGVHFNFSFPESFWDSLYGEQSEAERKACKSEGYFTLIRNYYHFGWLIPYLFGASPALCESFLDGKQSALPFEKLGKTLYLPYATSLRLSDLGYTNTSQSELKISYNTLELYLEGMNRAIRTPSEEFARIGVRAGGEHRQLNANILQIENELYAPIRPKRVAKFGEKPSEALQRGGVEYIEVRALDVNPFSPVGITEQQIRFLDLFLTWCLIRDARCMDNKELGCWKDNWNQVILEGRKPGLILKAGCCGEQIALADFGREIFSELKAIAGVMDSACGGNDYLSTCQELETWIEHPELTLSGQLLDKIQECGGNGLAGRQIGEAFREQHLAHEYRYYTHQQMLDEVENSRKTQHNMEQEDTQSFDEFLADYFSYLND